ncbi:MAG: EAL domain-containing protein, partial [Desulfohalobiaceae bacterium]|nr:EAL domain-containing protein [Desulfohalobiaceae bacterium]
YKNDTRRGKKFIGTYGVMRDMRERKRSEEVIRYHLYHDSLTSLPNRALFNDRLHMALLQAKRHKNKLALMFLDLDRFKKINDNFGHQAGDEILQSVAKKLKRCVRETDTLARIGGDEFLLMMQDLPSAEDADRVCQKILDRLNQPMRYRGKEIRITASIGIALYPDHGKTKDELIRHADIAMYRVKEKSCNGYCLYNNTLISDYPNLELENDLYSAVQRNELLLYYQPQIEAVCNKVVGIEALMRWDHPQYGTLGPACFIPIAEQNGLINEIGDWGLRQACADTKDLEAEGFFPLKTSVNISVQQLSSSNFVQNVLQIIHGCGLRQNSMELEITESCLMHDLQNASEMLEELTQGGVSIAIDDFGSGYSSLNYLQNLSINTLKLDRGFIQQANLASSEKTIFTAIQSMAQSLDVNFVAEGVETHAQKKYLERLGFCSIVQGYYYSKPLPLAELKTFIAQQNDIGGL